jgi:hypothetical protein
MERIEKKSKKFPLVMRLNGYDRKIAGEFFYKTIVLLSHR